MTALIFLVPLALAMACLGLLAFFWTVKAHQYDDLQGAAERILLDEEES